LILYNILNNTKCRKPIPRIFTRNGFYFFIYYQRLQKRMNHIINIQNPFSDKKTGTETE